MDAVLETVGDGDAAEERVGGNVRVVEDCSEGVAPPVVVADTEGEIEALAVSEKIDTVGDAELERLPDPVTDGDTDAEEQLDIVVDTDPEAESDGEPLTVTVPLELEEEVLDEETERDTDGDDDADAADDRLTSAFVGDCDSEACVEAVADDDRHPVSDCESVTVPDTEPQRVTVPDGVLDDVRLPVIVAERVCDLVDVVEGDMVDVEVTDDDIDELGTRDAVGMGVTVCDSDGLAVVDTDCVADDERLPRSDPVVDNVGVPLALADGDTDTLGVKVPLAVIDTDKDEELLLDREPVLEADAKLPDEEGLGVSVVELETDGVFDTVALCDGRSVTVPVAAPVAVLGAEALGDPVLLRDIVTDTVTVRDAVLLRDGTSDDVLAPLAEEHPLIDGEPELVRDAV